MVFGILGHQINSLSVFRFLSERDTADRNYALSYYMKEYRCFPDESQVYEKAKVFSFSAPFSLLYHLSVSLILSLFVYTFSEEIFSDFYRNNSPLCDVNLSLALLTRRNLEIFSDF